jgi:hypothetical protein
MEAAEVLGVDETRVRAVLNKKVDNLHQTIARSPLQRRGGHASSKCIDFRALLDKICTHRDLTSHHSQV